MAQAQDSALKIYKKTRNSYIAYKAAFTRIEGINERLIEYAPAVATPQTVLELEKALTKIEDQYNKVQKCSEDLIQIEDDDDEIVEIHKYLDKIGDRYEKNRAIILDTIKVVDVPRRESVTTTRGTPATGAAGGGATPKLNVNKSLKPFTLLATHNPTEFKNWGRQFKAYYRSSHMETLEVPDQQIYLQSCLEPKLHSKIFNKMDDTTPIFNAGGCIELLQEDFEQRWPLFNRRLAFFRSAQQPGQDVSAWVGELQELAEEADIPELRAEDTILFRILCGIHNQKIRHELTKIQKPTLKDYTDKITEMEVSRRMESSLDVSSRPTAKAAAVKHKKNRNTSKASAVSKKDIIASLKGKCFRCGYDRHEKGPCPKADATCQACNAKGHTAKVCFKRLMGELPDKQKGKPPKAQAAAVQSTTKEQSGQCSSDDDANTESVTVVKHRLFCIKTLTVSTISGDKLGLANPTPRTSVKVRSSNGAKFRMKALPDTGCTTTLISDDLRKKYALRSKRSTAKLVAADDSELDCSGKVEILIDNVKTMALVTKSLKDELIIGWPDLIRLGIISPNFPERTVHTANKVEHGDTDEALTKLKQQYKDILTDHLPEDPMKGPQMKIHLKPNAKPRRVTTTKAIPHHWEEQADATLKKTTSRRCH